MIPRFDCVGIEHLLTARWFELNQPWRRFKCDLDHIKAQMRRMLDEVGITDWPEIRECCDVRGGYIRMPLPRHVCNCTPEWHGLCYRHTVECERRNYGFMYAWNSLEAATYGVDWPYKRPSLWYTAYEAQQALEQLGITYTEAMDRLQLSVDTVWAEHFRGIVCHHWYHYEGDLQMHMEHPDWLPREIESVQAWRLEHNKPLPDGVAEIVYTVSLG